MFVPSSAPCWRRIRTKEHTMLRKYALNGLVTLSIAAAPVAAPTAMAKDNVDKILLGLVAIGIVGAIAHEANDKKKQRRVERHTPVFDPHTEDFRPKKKRHHVKGDRHSHGNIVHRHKHGGYHNHDRLRGRDGVGVKRKHVYKKHQKPRHCLRQRWTNQGWVKFYSKRCLHKHGY